MAKREYDPVETTLIEDAACDALDLLNDCDAGAVTRFVRSGDRLLRLRLSVVPVEDAEVPEVYNGKTAKEWYSIRAKQALHLAGAIMLLKRCKDRVDAGDQLFVDIRKFLVQEVNAE